MKSTLSDNRQLFNVKAIAPAGLAPDEIPNDTLGIIDMSTGLSVSPTTYNTMPDEYKLVAKVNNKFYLSFDEIEKSKVISATKQPYQAPQVNVWEGVIENCDCMESAILKINIEDDALLRRDGMRHSHTDLYFELSPKDLKCHCSCVKKSVYDNNIMTSLFVEKVNAANSQFYEASAKIDLTDVAVYADDAARDAAITAPVAGQVVVSGVSLTQYDGTAWAIIGDDQGNVADPMAFTLASKEVNTDEDETNDGEKLILVISSKIPGLSSYSDLDVQYEYPRGTRIMPSVQTNGSTNIQFTEVQEIQYELNAGMDLRKEEFDNMSLYTDLNFYPQLTDGIASRDLVYQFENNKQYNVVNIEFLSKKSGLEDVHESTHKTFSVLLASETLAVYNILATLFGA